MDLDGVLLLMLGGIVSLVFQLHAWQRITDPRTLSDAVTALYFVGFSLTTVGCLLGAVYLVT